MKKSAKKRSVPSDARMMAARRAVPGGRKRSDKLIEFSGVTLKNGRQISVDVCNCMKVVKYSWSCTCIVVANMVVSWFGWHCMNGQVQLNCTCIIVADMVLLHDTKTAE